jgi:hypothetical protein
MSELLIFDNNQLKSIKEMLLSKDQESIELAFGMLSAFDYNNKEELNKLSDYIYGIISGMPLIYDPNTFEPKFKPTKSKLIYTIEKLKFKYESKQC